MVAAIDPRRQYAGVLVLGIDVGTQGARAVICDGQGRGVAEAERPFPLAAATSLPPGWAEQDPNQWWSASAEVIREAIGKLPASGRGPADVAAVSVTSTSGTLCDVDAAGERQGPALMYNDRRSDAEAAEVNRVGVELAGKLGYRFAASFSLPKLLWLARNDADRFRRARWFLSPTDFINGRLTGDWGYTDHTNALKAGYDLLEGQWPSFIERELGIALERLPEVVAPGARIGEVTASAATATGLRGGTPVVAGMTDGCASQVATGAIGLGDWSSTLGTTLVIKGVSRDLLRDPKGRVYCHKHPDGYWLPGGASNTGGECIARRFEKAELAGLARLAPLRTPTGLLVYPLTRKGERFPFNHGDAEGFTIGETTDRAMLYTAYLEGVAYVERLAYDVLVELGAPPAAAVSIAGGTAKVDAWTQIRADVLQKTLLVPESSGGAMGAAIVAAGSVMHDGLVAAARAMVRIGKRVQPRPELKAHYDERYARFRAELVRRGYVQEPA